MSRRRHRLALGLFVLATTSTRGSENLEEQRAVLRDFQQQVAELTAGLSADSQMRSDLETGLRRLADLTNDVQEIMSDMESASPRAEHRQRNMEEKGRWFEQLRDGMEPQLKARFGAAKASLDREYAELQARRAALSPKNEAAVGAFIRDNDDYNRRRELHDAAVRTFAAELDAAVRTAFEALQVAMREFQEAHERSAKLNEQYNATTSDYAAARQALALLVNQAREARPVIAHGLQLSGQVPHTQPDSVPWDDLRIAARNSLAAARTPDGFAASARARIKFDLPPRDGEGAVPLEIEDDVAAVEGVPASGSTASPILPPPLTVDGREQRAQIARLDELYRLRNDIARYPQSYAPDALSDVINDITATHSKIITAAYEQKVAQQGSRKHSLRIRQTSDSTSPAR